MRDLAPPIFSSILQQSIMALGKRKAFQDVPPPRKKRRATSAIQEISFDFSAREDYLTGFHKRKLQRIKHAKEEATKKDREDKLAARKIVCLALLLLPCEADWKATATRRAKSRPGEACGNR